MRTARSATCPPQAPKNLGYCHHFRRRRRRQLEKPPFFDLKTTQNLLSADIKHCKESILDRRAGGGVGAVCPACLRASGPSENVSTGSSGWQLRRRRGHQWGQQRRRGAKETQTCLHRNGHPPRPDRRTRGQRSSSERIVGVHIRAPRDQYTD